MRSTRTGYLVIRCVTSKMHSGTPNRRTIDRLLIFWKTIRWENYSKQCWGQTNVSNIETYKISTYPHEVLELLVALQLLFVVVDSFSVPTAEIPITFLHSLSKLSRKLKPDAHKITSCLTCAVCHTSCFTLPSQCFFFTPPVVTLVTTACVKQKV